MLWWKDSSLNYICPETIHLTPITASSHVNSTLLHHNPSYQNFRYDKQLWVTWFTCHIIFTTHRKSWFVYNIPASRKPFQNWPKFKTGISVSFSEFHDFRFEHYLDDTIKSGCFSKDFKGTVVSSKCLFLWKKLRGLLLCQVSGNRFAHVGQIYGSKMEFCLGVEDGKMQNHSWWRGRQWHFGGSRTHLGLLQSQFFFFFF